MLDVALSELIGQFYNAAIDARRWPDTLDRLRRHFGFQMAVLSILRLPGPAVIVQAASNVPDEYLLKFADYDEEIADLWGGRAGLARMPLEEPLLNTNLVPFATLAKTRFYREWAEPQGIVDQVGIMLSYDERLVANLGLSIHKDAGPPSEEQFHSLRLIAPHLRRAATIGSLLNAAANATMSFSATLDVIRSGVVLVDARLRIVHSNASAAEMLRAGDPIRAVSGRLELLDEVISGQLDAAVQVAAESEADLGHKGMGIPARRRDGTGITVHVMPLARRAVPGGLPAEATVAVFVSEEASRVLAPTDTVMMVHGLTPAEARVFELVVAGKSSDEMASELGIATSTIRTHLLRVFAKTGRHDRSGLVRLAVEMRRP